MSDIGRACGTFRQVLPKNIWDAVRRQTLDEDLKCYPPSMEHVT